MAPKNEEPLEYRFHIDAYSPETIPLDRLSEYLGYLARIMGEKGSVHLSRIEAGSTVPVIRVDFEAAPKVRDRIHAVGVSAGPADSQRAYREMNKRLAEDNANGVLVGPDKARTLRFPGRDAATQVQFGPITEVGAFEGVPIRIGGERDPVPVHLQDGDQTHIILAPRRLAKVIADSLFVSPIRVEGRGKWIRNRVGEWELMEFIAETAMPLTNGDLRADLGLLQAIPARWKTLEDPLAILTENRRDQVAQ